MRQEVGKRLHFSARRTRSEIRALLYRWDRYAAIMICTINSLSRLHQSRPARDERVVSGSPAHGGSRSGISSRFDGVLVDFCGVPGTFGMCVYTSGCVGFCIFVFVCLFPRLCMCTGECEREKETAHACFYANTCDRLKTAIKLQHRLAA